MVEDKVVCWIARLLVALQSLAMPQSATIRYDGTKVAIAFAAVGLVFASLGFGSYGLRHLGLDPSAGSSGIMPWYLHEKALLIGTVIGAMCLATGASLWLVFRTRLAVALELTQSGIATLWRVPKASVPWSEVGSADISEDRLRVFDRSGACRLELPVALIRETPQEILRLIETFRNASRGLQRGPGFRPRNPSGGFGRR
jgi:hypothetical protein